MDVLDRAAELAAQEAWEGGDYDAKAPWRELPETRRRSLVGFTRRVLSWMGQEDAARLRVALNRYYETTSQRSSLEWLGFNGDRFHPAHFAVIAQDNGDGSQTRRLCKAEYAERDHQMRRRVAKRGDDPFETAVTVMAEWQTWYADFWRERIEHPKPGAFVADGKHYTIGEDKGGPKEFRGFAGSEATVIYDDGRIVHTTNLWYQGSVPPQVREQVDAVVPHATLLWGHHLANHEPPYHKPITEGMGCPTCQPVETRA